MWPVIRGQEATCKDFRELMARKDIDAVQITTPDHWHPLMALEAIRQGKHMYCEKPIGWSIRAAQVLRKAVQESGVVFQFGTQQRSGGKFRFACELVRNGKIGQLKTILVGVPGSWTCQRSPPSRFPRNWTTTLWLGPAARGPLLLPALPALDGEGRLQRLVLHLRLLHGHDRQLGRPPPRHRPVGKRHGTERADGDRRHGRLPRGPLTDAATSWQVENRYANGVTLVHMDDGTAKKHPLQVAATATACCSSAARAGSTWTAG